MMLPLRVHIEDDGLVGGGLDEGPEGILVDLSNLPHFHCGSHRVQARPYPYHSTTSSSSTHGGLWVWDPVGGECDRVLGGVVEDRLRGPNGWSGEREVQSHCFWVESTEAFRCVCLCVCVSNFTEKMRGEGPELCWGTVWKDGFNLLILVDYENRRGVFVTIIPGSRY